MLFPFAIKMCIRDRIEGIKLKDNLRTIAPTNFGREITMPVSDILKDKQDKHYTIAKAALRSLSVKHIEYEDCLLYTS